MRDLDQLAVDSVPCPRCAARPGDECVSRSGRRSTYTHAGRTTPVRAAWRIGYGEGVLEVVDEVRLRGRPSRWQLEVADDTRP